MLVINEKWHLILRQAFSPFRSPTLFSSSFVPLWLWFWRPRIEILELNLICVNLRTGFDKSKLHRLVVPDFSRCFTMEWGSVYSHKKEKKSGRRQRCGGEANDEKKNKRKSHPQTSFQPLTRGTVCNIRSTSSSSKIDSHPLRVPTRRSM